MPRGERLMLRLFALLAAILALAWFKLPYFGVSLTAPLFAWIALEAAAKRGLHPPPLWTWLAVLFWLALLCSLAGNLVAGRLGAIGAEELVMLTRYGFWLTVFVVTAGLTARAVWTPELVRRLAIAAVALVLMRLADAATGDPGWLHQNEYGLRFSAFTPFLLAGCLASGGMASMGALSLCAAALLLNGSRSSWIALAAAGFALLLLRGLAGRGVRGPALALIVVPVMLAGCAAFAPPQWSRSVADRFASFHQLETDKPFLTRVAMVAKGWALFEQQPVFGAGLGRFDLSRVRLAGAYTPWTNDEALNRRSSHNAYLSLLAETGLVGSLAFAALLTALLVGGARSAYRLMRRGEDWAGGVWASALAISIHLTAISGLTGTLPWFVFGLMAGVVERDRRGALR